MLGNEEIRQKLLDLPEHFLVHYRKKEYAMAKYCYDTARTVALFVGLDESDMLRLFGSRQDPENPIEGEFSEERVQKCYLECIKTNQTHERATYPGRPKTA